MNLQKPANADPRSLSCRLFGFLMLHEAIPDGNLYTILSLDIPWPERPLRMRQGSVTRRPWYRGTWMLRECKWTLLLAGGLSKPGAADLVLRSKAGGFD